MPTINQILHTRVVETELARITQLATIGTHNGTDLTGYTTLPVVTGILAHSNGTVQQIGVSETDGNYIILNHGNGFITYYCHIADNTILVSQGDTVTAGQKIGTMGSTGTATGAHLHFEVRLNNTAKDSYPYLNNILTVDYNIHDKDTVRLKPSAYKYGTTTYFDDTVYNSVLTVSGEPEGNKVRISLNNVIVGYCYISNLTLVEAYVPPVIIPSVFKVVVNDTEDFIVKEFDEVTNIALIDGVYIITNSGTEYRYSAEDYILQLL